LVASPVARPDNPVRTERAGVRTGVARLKGSELWGATKLVIPKLTYPTTDNVMLRACGAMFQTESFIKHP